MSEKEDNKKEVKSKIEQIRIDLEKKLAAIEKTKPGFEVSDAKLDAVDSDMSESNALTDLDPVFEISEPIESIEDKNETVIAPILESKIVLKSVDNKEAKSNSKKEIIVADNKVVSTPPKTIVASMNNEDDIENEILELEERKSKKGIFSYLIYGFLIALFFVIGYLAVDYMKENKNLQNDKMNQKLSEFKNKRYLDSIELADLNNQLLDMQSEKMIDSLDRVYENELIANSKFTNKNNVKRNYKFSNDRKNIQSTQNINTNKPSIVSSNVNNSESTNQIDTETNKSTETNGESSNSIASNKSNLPSEKNELGKKEENELSKEEIAENKKPKVVKAPVYPGCEKKKSEFNRKKCLTAKMYRHVNRKFNSSIAQNSGLSDGLHQVKVSFIIDKRGYATVLHVRGENKKLEQEAIRVIQTLPKMKPGTIDGNKSKMQYMIPIKFVINN